MNMLIAQFEFIKIIKMTLTSSSWAFCRSHTSLMGGVKDKNKTIGSVSVMKIKLFVTSIEDTFFAFALTLDDGARFRVLAIFGFNRSN